MTLKSLFAFFLGLSVAAGVAAQDIAAPPPTPTLNPENELALDLSTGGRVVIQLRPDVAPRHVERIKALARRGFYNGLIFHRVIDGFMAQTGDPKGDGTGGSDLPNLAPEFNGLPHMRGAVSAARTQDLSGANSQFFIMLSPRLVLDGQYTVFGRVISGMQYVDAVQRGEPPAQPSRIVQASILSDNKPMPPASALTEAVAAAPAVGGSALQGFSVGRSVPAASKVAGPAVPPPPSIRPPDPPQPKKKPSSGH
jgi:cyclophilin family peptidyl-prolyl cis-trans isomerase